MSSPLDRYQAAPGSFDGPDAEPPVPNGYWVAGPWEPVMAWEAERVEPGPIGDVPFKQGRPSGSRPEMETRVLWRRPLRREGVLEAAGGYPHAEVGP